MRWPWSRWTEARRYYPDGYAAWHAQGWATLPTHHYPHLETVLPQLTAWATQQRDTLDYAAVMTAHPHIKPFYFNLLTRADLRQMPALSQWAVSNEVLNLLVPYYHHLPYVSHLAVFLTQYGHPCEQTAKPIGTQRLHLDSRDPRHVKLFVPLTDTTMNDGPMVVVNKERSASLRRATRRWYQWRRTSPFTVDADFLPYLQEKDLTPLVGPVGQLHIVDTSHCWHYGSRRGVGGSRLTLVVHYTDRLYSRYRSEDYMDLNLLASPECRPANLTRAQQLVWPLITPMEETHVKPG